MYFFCFTFARSFLTTINIVKGSAAAAATADTEDIFLSKRQCIAVD